MSRLFPRAIVAATALVAASASRAADPVLAPSEIVAAAPAADWTAIAPTDLLVMDLAPDGAGHPRRVVIQLMPAPFAQGWIANIRKLAAAHWWDGTSVNRAQDNYVVQWGDPDGEDKAKARVLPAGLVKPEEAAYSVVFPRIPMSLPDGRSVDRPANPLAVKWIVPSELRADPYSALVGTTASGWPVASDGASLWPIHCYGMVGVGRDMPPDTGSGAELYAVIGTPPRHLDRNIALIGRVIEGMEHLSTLPRGTGDLGFYKTAAERTPIRSIRLGTEVPGLPAWQYLSTESASFARYADARANRRDAFFIYPAGGVDICNLPVPIRRTPNVPKP